MVAGKTIKFLVRNGEEGVVHFQRQENAFPEEHIEGLAAEFLNDGAENIECDTVVITRTRLKTQRQFCEPADKIVEVSTGEEFRVPVQAVDHFRVGTIAGGKTGRVCEQLLYGWIEGFFRRFAVPEQRQVGQLGQVFRYRVVHLKLVFFVEHHHRDGRHRLGH